MARPATLAAESIEYNSVGKSVLRPPRQWRTPRAKQATLPAPPPHLPRDERDLVAPAPHRSPAASKRPGMRAFEEAPWSKTRAALYAQQLSNGTHRRGSLASSGQ